MEINPINFPQVTNRQSWTWVLDFIDDDTDDRLDLTGLTFAMEIRYQPRAPQLGDYSYTPYYDYGSLDCAGPVLTLALGSGLTVIDVGKLQVQITAAQMRTLQPGTYNIAMTVSSTDETVQAFVGELPVIFGGVT